jgi:hypothetical protein
MAENRKLACSLWWLRSGVFIDIAGTKLTREVEYFRRGLQITPKLFLSAIASLETDQRGLASKVGVHDTIKQDQEPAALQHQATFRQAHTH